MFFFYHIYSNTCQIELDGSTKFIKVCRKFSLFKFLFLKFMTLILEKCQNFDFIFLSSILSNNVLMMSSGLCKPYLVTLLPL